MPFSKVQLRSANELLIAYVHSLLQVCLFWCMGSCWSCVVELGMENVMENYKDWKLTLALLPPRVRTDGQRGEARWPGLFKANLPVALKEIKLLKSHVSSRALVPALCVAFELAARFDLEAKRWESRHGMWLSFSRGSHEWIKDSPHTVFLPSWGCAFSHGTDASGHNHTLLNKPSFTTFAKVYWIANKRSFFFILDVVSKCDIILFCCNLFLLDVTFVLSLRVYFTLLYLLVCENPL